MLIETIITSTSSLGIEIKSEILSKLYSPNFQKILCSLKNPYESQDGSKIILEVTLDYLKTRKDIKKEFFDISVKNI